MPKVDLSKLISAEEKAAHAEAERAGRAATLRSQEAQAKLRAAPFPATPNNAQLAARLRLIEQVLGIG